jgi:NAD(P)-dependent dehydrogenase (short-subunit alcohol dehydrogenase family)
MASGQAFVPGTNISAYAASKGGVVSLTRALAAELAPKVRVNAVSPGMVATPMALGDKSADAIDASNYALKRIATPEEIAQSLLFLTSTQSSFITGSTLSVDGGRTYH